MPSENNDLHQRIEATQAVEKGFVLQIRNDDSGPSEHNVSEKGIETEGKGIETEQVMKNEDVLQKQTNLMERNPDDSD